MFLLAKPSQRDIEKFLAAGKLDNFSYPEIGATQERAPSGYAIDHNRIKLGIGSATFEQAKLAIRQWKMFDLGWVKLYKQSTPIEIGETVAVEAAHFGFYSLSAARIVYAIDESGETDRFGFAYGTLRDHAEIGEERFSVEFHHDGGEVWYDLYAFSKPGAILAKIGYPLGRYLQKAFARDSKIAMANFVSR
jgi:uncharacterized protein (UPF0548 family)